MASADKTLLKRLSSSLGREDLTIDELVEEADGLLAELAPKQSRYKVTERPDARTVRYYVTQKLLDKPLSYEGGRARYSGRHLLRLLLIKKLQAEHHSLQQIARLLEASDDEALVEKLIPKARSYVKGQLKPIASHRLVASTPRATESRTFERIALPGGASLDVPSTLFHDRARRRELADRLESLARSLRSSSASK